ncbi:MAG: NAD(P)-dependent oxidoreductase [Phycisphaerales bacterium JB040]
MPEALRVLVADKFEASGIAGLEQLGASVTLSPDLGPDTLPDALAGVEVLVVRSTKVPSSVIESADALRVIVRAGSGYDNIDCEAAGARGIAVCNCPGMNAVAVAELAMGHLIALDRRIPEQHEALRAGRWDKKEFSKAKGLKGRSILIVGTGAIGTEMITRCKAFGMRVYAQSRSLGHDTARALGIEPIPYTREALHETLGKVDAVSIHVAATPDTVDLCNAAFFHAMQPGAYFINTSRGELVDEGALAEAVRSKGIRAAVDVYRDQPGEKQCDWTTPLATLPNVHGTHHCGASTDQAQLAVADEVVRIVKTYRDEHRCINVVNESELATA